jgi:mono/diheme cytochrome c family protein
MRFRERNCRNMPIVSLAIAAVFVLLLCCMSWSGSGGLALGSPADSSAGKKLYDSRGCVACHTIGGKGGTLGPNLSDEANKGRTAQWLTSQLRNPKAYVANSIMPACGDLSDQQTSDLVAYLMTLSTSGKTSSAPAPATRKAPSSAPEANQPTTAPKNVAAGAQMWSDNCGRCHNYRAPSEFSRSQWAVVMQHMRLRASLTGEQQRQILEFLQASR